MNAVAGTVPSREPQRPESDGADEALSTLRTAGSHPILRGFPQGAIIVFDFDLRYLCAAGLGLADVGLSREMLEGHTVDEVFPPEVVAHITPLYRSALSGQSTQIDVPYEGRIYSQRLGPLVDPAGRIIAGMGFTQDVTDTRQFERDLAEESRRLRDAEVIGRVGSWELDLRDQSVNWSTGIFDLYGLREDNFQGDYAAALNCIHPDDRAQVNAGVQACVTSGVPLRTRYRINRFNDGQLRWIDTRGEAQYEAGERVRIVGAIADITEHVLAEMQARDDQAFQQAVIDGSPDIIFVYNVGSRSTTWSNRSQLEILGYAVTPGSPTASVDSFIPKEERGQFDAALAAAAAAQPGQVVQVNHRLRAADGTYRWFSRRITSFRRDDDGKVTELVGVLRDVTEAVTAEQQLRHSALHDNLTGLPNRALLMDRLEGAIARVDRSKREICVLFCDLDGFKRINDTAGHAAGDQVLLEISSRLQVAVRDGDTVARIGGDEFVLIIEPWNRDGDDGNATPDEDRAAATRIADRVRQAVRRPVAVQGTEHVVSISIGLAFGPHVPAGPGRVSRVDQLLQDADAAMYRAKTRGKDRFEIFHEGMRTYGVEPTRVEQAPNSGR